MLVATALIELGMKYEDAVDLIRKKRRGAINAKQLEFLSKYKRRKYFIKVKEDKLSRMKYLLKQNFFRGRTSARYNRVINPESQALFLSLEF